MVSRPLIGALVLAGLSLSAAAQEPQRIRLDLTEEQVKLIVSTLPSIQCASVAQLVICQQAIDLLTEIKKQAVSQTPK